MSKNIFNITTSASGGSGGVSSNGDPLVEDAIIFGAVLKISHSSTTVQRTIQIADIQIIDMTNLNIVSNGTPSQSSTQSGFPAANAIDNNAATYSSTTAELNPFWKIVLPGSVRLKTLRIRPRQDLPGALSGATVQLFSDVAETQLIISLVLGTFDTNNVDFRDIDLTGSTISNLFVTSNTINGIDLGFITDHENTLNSLVSFVNPSSGDAKFTNLTVENVMQVGTITYQGTSQLNVTDSLVKLANGNTADILDSGIYTQYNAGAGLRYNGIMWKRGTQELLLIAGSPTEPTPTGGLYTGYYANTRIGNLTCGIIDASNIIVQGNVDGRDVSADGANLDTLYTTNNLASLNSTIVAQLLNIGATTISSTRWQNLSELNQSVATTAAPTFANLTIVGTVNGRDVDNDGARLDTLYTTNNLASLTSGIVAQLLNIGATTISAANWSYVSTLNQNVATTSAPTFAGGVTTPTTTFSGANYRIQSTNDLANVPFEVNSRAIIVADTVGETSNPVLIVRKKPFGAGVHDIITLEKTSDDAIDVALAYKRQSGSVYARLNAKNDISTGVAEFSTELSGAKVITARRTITASTFEFGDSATTSEIIIGTNSAKLRLANTAALYNTANTLNIDVDAISALQLVNTAGAINVIAPGNLVTATTFSSAGTFARLQLGADNFTLANNHTASVNVPFFPASGIRATTSANLTIANSPATTTFATFNIATNETEINAPLRANSLQTLTAATSLAIKNYAGNTVITIPPTSTALDIASTISTTAVVAKQSLPLYVRTFAGNTIVQFSDSLQSLSTTFAGTIFATNITATTNAIAIQSQNTFSSFNLNNDGIKVKGSFYADPTSDIAFYNTTMTRGAVVNKDSGALYFSSYYNANNLINDYRLTNIELTNGTASSSLSVEIDTSFNVVNAVIEGSYFYASYAKSDTSRIKIYEISDHKQIAELSIITLTTATPFFVAVQDVLLYGASQNEFRVYSITNRSAPTLISTTAFTLTGISHIRASGNIVYVTTSNSFRAIDVSNTAAPILTKIVALGSTSAPTTIDAESGYIYIAANDTQMLTPFGPHLHVLRTTKNAADPLLQLSAALGDYDAYYANQPFNARLMVSGRHIFMVVNDPANNLASRVLVFRRDNADAPTLVATQNLSVSSAITPLVLGRTLFIASQTTGNIQMFDISNDSQLTMFGTITTSNMIRIDELAVYDKVLIAIGKNISGRVAVSSFDLQGTYSTALSAGAISTDFINVRENFVCTNAVVKGGAYITKALNCSGFNSLDQVNVNVSSANRHAFNANIASSTASALQIVGENTWSGAGLHISGIKNTGISLINSETSWTSGGVLSATGYRGTSGAAITIGGEYYAGAQLAGFLTDGITAEYSPSTSATGYAAFNARVYAANAGMRVNLMNAGGQGIIIADNSFAGTYALDIDWKSGTTSAARIIGNTTSPVLELNGGSTYALDVTGGAKITTRIDVPEIRALTNDIYVRTNDAQSGVLIKNNSGNIIFGDTVRASQRAQFTFDTKSANVVAQTINWTDMDLVRPGNVLSVLNDSALFAIWQERTLVPSEVRNAIRIYTRAEYGGAGTSPVFDTASTSKYIAYEYPPDASLSDIVPVAFDQVIGCAAVAVQNTIFVHNVRASNIASGYTVSANTTTLPYRIFFATSSLLIAVTPVDIYLFRIEIVPTLSITLIYQIQPAVPSNTISDAQIVSGNLYMITTSGKLACIENITSYTEARVNNVTISAAATNIATGSALRFAIDSYRNAVYIFRSNSAQIARTTLSETFDVTNVTFATLATSPIPSGYTLPTSCSPQIFGRNMFIPCTNGTNSKVIVVNLDNPAQMTLPQLCEYTVNAGIIRQFTLTGCKLCVAYYLTADANLGRIAVFDLGGTYADTLETSMLTTDRALAKSVTVANDAAVQGSVSIGGDLHMVGGLSTLYVKEGKIDVRSAYTSNFTATGADPVLNISGQNAAQIVGKLTIDGNIVQTSGTAYSAIRTISTTSATLLISDAVVRVTNNAAVTVTLPAAANTFGAQRITLINVASSALTIVAAGSDTINGIYTSFGPITQLHTTMQLLSDNLGTWYVL